MVFTSAAFILFLPLTYLLFRLCRQPYRWLVLLGASFYFYAALEVYSLLAVLLLVSALAYGGGLWLAGEQPERSRRRRLWLVILAVLSPLLGMKYLPFLADNLNALGAALGVECAVSAPVLVSIGVSYYVFQAISYLLDVYWGKCAVERHFGYFLLYMALFAKLLQGPIERAGQLLPQLRVPFKFDYAVTRASLVLFAWGLFKKLVIADRLGVYVDAVYTDPGAFSGAPLWLATYAYAFQIYCDFSGYTDMALGVAGLFNLRLTQNFAGPYLATSVADFWRRWHISFSRWILDYIFSPLQMIWRQWRTRATVAALLVTFLVSGVWHGAAWTFIVWGLLHGLFLAGEVLYKPYQKRLHQRFGLAKTRRLKVGQTLVTFHLVCFAWIFFRAGSLADAWHVATHLLSPAGTGGWWAGNPGLAVFRDGWLSYDLPLALAGLAVLGLVALAKSRRPLFELPAGLRWAAYCGLVTVTLWFGIMTSSAFIYFEF